MFPADHFLKIYLEMYAYLKFYIDLVAGKQVQYLYFEFRCLAAKRLFYAMHAMRR